MRSRGPAPVSPGPEAGESFPGAGRAFQTAKPPLCTPGGEQWKARRGRAPQSKAEAGRLGLGNGRQWQRKLWETINQRDICICHQLHPGSGNCPRGAGGPVEGSPVGSGQGTARSLRPQLWALRGWRPPLPPHQPGLLVFKNLLTLSPFNRGRPSLFFFFSLRKKKGTRVNIRACVCVQGKPLIRFVPSSYRELLSII